MSVLRPVNCIVTLFSGLKDALFNAYLLEDASYLLFSLVLIMLLVWAYTASLTITLASLSSIAASLGLAYFTYTFVLRLTFFPFMNVLAVVIALGVGADDTFILSRYVETTTSTFLSNAPCSTLYSVLQVLVSEAGRVPAELRLQERQARGSGELHNNNNN